MSCPKNIYSLNIEDVSKSEVLVTTNDTITYSTIDSIHEYLAYVTDSKKITITDKTCKKYKWDDLRDKYSIESKGNQQILGIDFNPNKQYYLMASYMSSLKFFDIRKGNLPVKCHD